MANKKYSQYPADSVKESAGKKGMKNVDARVGGEAYDKQHKADFNPKVSDRPSDDLVPLDGNREGLETGAY